MLANVLHVAELARQYERNDGLSFRGFVETLREAAERGDAAEAPIVEDGSDGVRLMTVHKAKGLEFPVVMLADITAKLAQLEASRLRSTRSTGAARCGSAAGRPSDLLDAQARSMAAMWPRACASPTWPRRGPAICWSCRRWATSRSTGGWVSPLNAAIYPPPAQRRAPLAAPGCPAFKRDSVLERPDGGIAPCIVGEPGPAPDRGRSRGSRSRVVGSGGAPSRRRTAVRLAASRS